MRELEGKYFDEYKRLDALCRDMLAADRGVSEYIEQMEAARAEGERLVPGWRDDYYALKHLRWLRNQIAHEADAAGCDAGELAQLREFYGRALKQQDPLALLHKARQPQRPRQAQTAGQRMAQRSAGQGAAGQGQRSSQSGAARNTGGGRAHTTYQTGSRQAQDAARPRPAAQGRSGRRAREKAPLRVWICAGVVLGLFLLLAVYLVLPA